MVQRVHYRKKNHHNTRSNKTKLVKTPGGRLTVHVLKKRTSVPKCADCKTSIHGIKAMRPRENAKAKKKDRTVCRAYGGTLCARCVRERIMRAFLFEEQKCVRQVLKEKRKQERKVQKVKEKKKKEAAAAEKKSNVKKGKKTTTKKKTK